MLIDMKKEWILSLCLKDDLYMDLSFINIHISMVITCEHYLCKHHLIEDHYGLEFRLIFMHIGSTCKGRLIESHFLIQPPVPPIVVN